MRLILVFYQCLYESLDAFRSKLGAIVGTEAAVEEILEFKDAVRRAHILVRGDAADAGLAASNVFCNGFETIDDYAKRNMFDRIYATNAVYNSDNALSRDWFIEVNVMKYAAYYIEALNINRSVSVLMDPIKKMHALCEKYNIELPKSL